MRVLCSTDASRLWCLLELLTFIEMGGGADQIDLSLADDQVPQAPWCRALKSLTMADVRRTRCYHDSDKALILGSIESAFGSHEAFNLRVQSIARDIRRRLVRDQIRIVPEAEV